MALSALVVADQVSELLYDYFSPERWKDIDLVLSCGDLPPSYLGFLVSVLNVPVLYVRGNHDGRYKPDEYAGCENIHGRIVEIGGVRFAGFEGSREYNGGACQYSEAAMRRTFHRMRLQTVRRGAPHVIVTHAPPAGCHDASDRCHQGFECFRDAMRIWKPSYLLHGHVHAYNGGPMETEVDGSAVINAFPYRVVHLEGEPQPAPRTEASSPAPDPSIAVRSPRAPAAS